MAIQTWIDLPFADGYYKFCFDYDQILELERRADMGIGAIYGRIYRGRYGIEEAAVALDGGAYRLKDLADVVLFALIGGNHGVVDGVEVKVSPTRAKELVDRYLLSPTDQRAVLIETWSLAFKALNALVMGHDPDAQEDVEAA